MFTFDVRGPARYFGGEDALRWRNASRTALSRSSPSGGGGSCAQWGGKIQASMASHVAANDQNSGSRKHPLDGRLG
jgi:hypothetical protein